MGGEFPRISGPIIGCWFKKGIPPSISPGYSSENSKYWFWVSLSKRIKNTEKMYLYNGLQLAYL